MVLFTMIPEKHIGNTSRWQLETGREYSTFFSSPNSFLHFHYGVGVVSAYMMTSVVTSPSQKMWGGGGHNKFEMHKKQYI